MRPAPTRPPPQWARGTPVPAVQRAQAPLPHPQPPPPQDETADPAANTGHHTSPWSKVWSVIAASDLDRAARVTVWRLLHGNLFVGAFQRHSHRGTVASHLWTHASCQGRLAMLTRVFLSCCPCSAPVWQWFANLWAAITQGPAPRLTADLLLADDPRGGWYPSAELLPRWHRLCFLLIRKLWAAYSTARLPPTAPSTAAQIAARVMADARAMIRRDWLLVDTDIRQHIDVLSDWLRGRQPYLSRSAFVSRWCHGEVLCRLAAGDTAQPDILWTAHHPIPLPHGPP
jgi:hypothetical protein